MNHKASIQSVARAMLNMLEDGVKAEVVVKTLAAYLVAERRTSDLEAITRKMTELRAKDGIYEANLTTARPVDGAIQEAVDELIRRQRSDVREVIINIDQDPALIGGLKLEAHDLSLDTTISNKLKHLYQLTDTR